MVPGEWKCDCFESSCNSDEDWPTVCKGFRVNGSTTVLKVAVIVLTTGL